MMYNILIFNQNLSRSREYGIGTFVEILKNIFINSDYNVYLIDIYCNSDEFNIFKYRKCRYIKFPKLDFSVTEIIYMLRLHIPNLSKSILFLNYYSQFKLAKGFSDNNINVVSIGIIHSFSWTWITKGNEKLLKKHTSKFNNSNDAISVRKHISDCNIDFSFLHKIITLSDDSAEILNKIYNLKQNGVITIPNCIKSMALNKNIKLQLKKEFNLDQYEKILLYVGRIDELKGINILLASYNMIISKRPESKLIIIGDGSLSILSGYINNAASKLIFTGKVSKLTLHKWYQIADVGILPSYSEECSFVGIEMMMHGLPIVASNGRGVRNMFHHMQNCLSVDCQSGRKVFEYELSEAILKILDSETLANDLRRKSRQWYLDHYQFKFMKENIYL